MDEYEIRIIKNQAGSVVYESTQLSDFAAIRRAEALAEDDDAVEVWRGMDCIFRRGGLPGCLDAA